MSGVFIIGEVWLMEPMRSINELTRRNVAIIAEMEKAAANLQSRGDWIADRIASWVGSWTFIIVQTTIVIVWIAFNLAAWIKHWDPYPFILLNLTLGIQAAYAAPILMISQNRQARLNERRNHLDLQINMLAEQETTEILRILRLLCEQSGVTMDTIDGQRALEQETKHAEIVKQIQGEIEEPLAETGPRVPAQTGVNGAQSALSSH
ncbi:MAG: DUF1003 domain-containing protein [Isosphaeraceae bacterium]